MPPPRRGAVLLTGASSGIGHATALRLAARGIVFAGVRAEADAEKLAREGGASLRPLLLDVTDAASIERARAAVAACGTRLDGIVNNAGIALAGPLEVLPAADLRRQFEVNFFGPLALAQAFLPLLRAHGGRIVNVSSIGGKLAAPFAGAYASSKFALEAASDALRVELRGIVHVAVVEPGAVNTPIWRRGAAESVRIFDAAPETLRAPYASAVRAMLQLSQTLERRGIAPERVAAAIEHALYARRPRARYLVGIDARLRLAVARLPEGVRDRIVAAVIGLPHRPAAARS